MIWRALSRSSRARRAEARSISTWASTSSSHGSRSPAMDASVPRQLRHPALQRLGFELGRDDVYSWDLFLAASHRGGGRARAFYGRHLDDLRQRGFRRALGWVEASNTPARVLYQKLGYRDVGERASHLFFSTFLVTGRRLFVRNGSRHPTPFDYRPLLEDRGPP